MLDRALISAVNWSEVVARYETLRIGSDGRRAEIEALGISITAFDARQAEIAAKLLEQTRPLGLSLADRACLALAIDRGGSAITADRAWAELDIGVEIILIR